MGRAEQVRPFCFWGLVVRVGITKGARMRKTVLAAMLVLMLGGCASSPDKMTAAYVSPMQYRDYDCNQIAGELQRVTRRAQELYGHLDKTASNDNAQMAVGMVLFWPALFFLEGGDGPEAAEYSRLKGERDALEQVAIQKHCDPSIVPPPVQPPKQETSEKEETRRNFNRPRNNTQGRRD